MIKRINLRKYKNVTPFIMLLILKNDTGVFSTDYTEKIFQKIESSESVKMHEGKIRINYKPTAQGSERIISNVVIGQSYEKLSLEYKIKLCENFQYSKGGKLPGLGSLNPTTGGNKAKDDSWSVRLMFGGHGQLIVYSYTQERTQKYGSSDIIENIRIKPGNEYLIQLEVWLNEKNSPGQIRVWVNKKHVFTDHNVIFRSKFNNTSSIQTILFQTFFGGHTPDWRPMDKHGNIVYTCAHFWDIRIKTT